MVGKGNGYRRFSIGESGKFALTRLKKKNSAGNGVGKRGGLRTGERNSWVGGGRVGKTSIATLLINDDDER